MSGAADHEEIGLEIADNNDDPQNIVAAPPHSGSNVEGEGSEEYDYGEDDED